MAIAKLLAEHCGLAGSDRLVKARADEVMFLLLLFILCVIVVIVLLYYCDIVIIVIKSFVVLILWSYWIKQLGQGKS